MPVDETEYVDYDVQLTNENGRERGIEKDDMVIKVGVPPRNDSRI